MTKEGCFASVAIDYYMSWVESPRQTWPPIFSKERAKPEDMAIQFQKEFKTLISESSLKNLGAKIPAGLKSMKSLNNKKIRMFDLVVSTISQVSLWAIIAPRSVPYLPSP